MSGKIRLLLSDVDGTLVTPDKTLTDAARDAVRALRQAGIAFAIASSRPPRGLQALIAALDLQTPFAAFNGGMLIAPDHSLLGCHTLAPHAAHRTLALIGDHGLAPWLYDADAWYVLDGAGPYVVRERNALGFAPTLVSSFSEALHGRAPKITGVSGDPRRIATCTAAIRAELEGSVIATQSQSYSLEVTHPMANKGAVVQALSRRLNIPPDQIATIGDSANDVFMFHESGLSIAMGNADEAVKAQAREVTDSNDADGFAKAVRTFILDAP